MTGNALRRDRVLAAWRGLRPGLQDVLIAAVVTAATLTMLMSDARFLDGGPELAWPLLAVAASAPLVLRRRFPIAVAAAAAVLTTLAAVLAGRDVGYLGAAVAIGSAAYHAAGRVPLLAVGAVAWTAAFGVTGGGGVEVGALVMYGGLGLAPVAVGYALRLQADRGADLARLERARSALERAEERARIARDVHDAVGHHLSAIRLQAVGARRSPDSAQTAERTLRTIADLSHRALTDIRELLEVLRDEAPEPGGPGLADLDPLVRGFDEQGLAVRLRVAADVERDLPAAVGSCVVRIVREALVNVLRHSAARAAVVRIDRAGGAVVVSVRDPGPARSPDAVGRDGTGGGIRGMAERANALGGTAEAGPDGRGGWGVRAALPWAPVHEGARA